MKNSRHSSKAHSSTRSSHSLMQWLMQIAANLAWNAW
jgi:hypothetical protein